MKHIKKKSCQMCDYGLGFPKVKLLPKCMTSVIGYQLTGFPTVNSQNPEIRTLHM